MLPKISSFQQKIKLNDLKEAEKYKPYTGIKAINRKCHCGDQILYLQDKDIKSVIVVIFRKLK